MENPQAMKNPQILSVPLSQIRPNPKNPRKIIDDQQVQACAASLSLVGQRTPAKVRLLNSQEQTQDPGRLYELIGGHIRFRAATQLGWKELQVMVVDVADKEAMLEAILDNRGQEMFWLELYEAVEQIVELDPNINQSEVAKKLSLDQPSVSRALKTLRFLNPMTRQRIYGNSINPDQPYKMPEVCMRRLLEAIARRFDRDDQLEPGRACMEAAVKQMLNLKLNEKGSAKLADWIKHGNPPEGFNLEAAAKLGTHAKIQHDPLLNLWKNLPPSLQIKKDDDGYQLNWKLKNYEVGLAVYGSLVWLNHLWEQLGQSRNNPEFQDKLGQLLQQGVEQGRRELLENAQRQAAAEKEKAEKERVKAEKQASREQARQARQAKAEQARAQRQARAQEREQKRGASKQQNAQEALEHLLRDLRQRMTQKLGQGAFMENMYRAALRGDKARLAGIKLCLENNEENEQFLKWIWKCLSKLQKLNKTSA